jgi:hypothetical protein
MVAQPASADSLWSFLWGKRHSRRHRVALRAALHCAGGTFWTTTADLSAGGALLRLDAAEVARTLPGSSGALAGLHEIFSEPFTARFSGRHVAVGARLVRVAWRPDDAGSFYLGCRFDAPLHVGQLRRLGLSPRGCGPESGIHALPSRLMPLQPDRTRRLVLEIRAQGTTGPPAYAGPVAGMNGSALAVSIRGADPTEVVAHLSGESFAIRVVQDGEPVWSDTAYILAVRLLEDGAPGVELVVLANGEPDARILRCFRPRGTRAAAG